MTSRADPAALPMLSHVLREIWERREGPTLTVEGYRATGGVRDAVARSAEALYDAMSASERIQLRHLLLRLVVPTEDGQPVRARVPRAKVAVDDAHARLVEQLVEARLLSIDGDSVQIAHQALLGAWPRLRDWFDEDVEGRRHLRHLAAAADAWDGMGRPDRRAVPRHPARPGARVAGPHRAGPRRDRGGVPRRVLRPVGGGAPGGRDPDRAGAHDQRPAAQRPRRRGPPARARPGRGTARHPGGGAGTAPAAPRPGRRHPGQCPAGGAQALTSDAASRSLLLGVAALQVDRSAPEWENLATTLARLGPLRRIRRTGDSAVSLAVDGDRSLVAVSLIRDGVRLYRAESLAPVPFADHTPAGAVEFSPDGRLLAAAAGPPGVDGRARAARVPVRLYDARTGARSPRQLGGWPAGADVGYGLSFSQDGRRLVAGVDRSVATGHLPGAAMVWDVARPSGPVSTVRVPRTPDVALSPDGRTVYTATPGARSVRAYDVRTGRLLRWAGSDLVGPARKSTMAVSPDGSTLAITAGNRILRFDTGTLAREPDLVGHTAEVEDLTYSHDGSMLLSTSADRSAIVWSTATGASIRVLAAHNDQVWGGGFGARDHTAYTASGDGTLMSWDVTGHGGFLAGTAHPAAVKRLGVSLVAPDGHTVVRIVAGRLWFLDTRTGRTTARSALGGPVATHAWSPDAHRLLTTGQGRLSVWDAGTGARVRTRGYPRGGVAAVFAGDGTEIYADDGHGHLQTLDARSLEVVRTMPIDTVVRALVPDPADRTVLALGSDGALTRLDPRRGTDIATSGPDLLFRDAQVAALSPDGSRLAAADPAGRLQLLDATTFRWIGTRSRAEWGFNVVFAPDGSQFASVQPDRIRLWDGRTGAYQASIPLPDLPVTGLYPAGRAGPGTSIAYLADSTGLLVTAADGRTWTVDTRLRTWVHRACEIAGRNLTRSEWRQFFPVRHYRAVCPQWPTSG